MDREEFQGTAKDSWGLREAVSLVRLAISSYISLFMFVSRDIKFSTDIS